MGCAGTGVLAVLVVSAGCIHMGPSTDPSESLGGAPRDRNGGLPTGDGFPGCAGSGPVRFQNSPMRFEDFVHLLPYGLMVGGHVTPVDHMYFGPPPGSTRDQFEVRAVADGVIYALQPRDTNVEASKPKLREWRMDIAHTCTFTTYFDLVTWLEPSLYDAWNRSQEQRSWQGIPVKAGQLVGRIGGQTLDFGAYDYNVTLPGFVVPAHYSEPWKIHTVDPFPYFEEPDRSMLLAKMLRQVEPRAGRIDYDVDGRLVGNWFEVGSGGYGHGGIRWDYWDGHFSFVYDFLDPSQIRFSIGNWSGQPAQFGVGGNSPDPKDVSPSTGIIKVELVHFGYGARNDPSATGLGGGPNSIVPGDDVYSYNFAGEKGTALLEMTGPRLLKVEVFPGKAAADVTGFTSAARMYER